MVCAWDRGDNNVRVNFRMMGVSILRALNHECWLERMGTPGALSE